jgi:hypothetical protein
MSYPFAHELDLVRVVPDAGLDLFVLINLYEAAGGWDALGTSVL